MVTSGTSLFPLNIGNDKLLHLAREIAIDHYSIEDILKNLQISTKEWESIQKSDAFQALLAEQIQAWHSVTNTHERTKLKAASLIEHWLPEAYARLSDQSEALPGKAKLFEVLMKLAGMGLTQNGAGEGGGERFSVTINLGADSKLTFEKELPAKVIEGASVEVKDD